MLQLFDLSLCRLLLILDILINLNLGFLRPRLARLLPLQPGASRESAFDLQEGELPANLYRRLTHFRSGMREARLCLFDLEPASRSGNRKFNQSEQSDRKVRVPVLEWNQNDSESVSSWMFQEPQQRRFLPRLPQQQLQLLRLGSLLPWFCQRRRRFARLLKENDRRLIHRLRLPMRSVSSV